MYVIRYIMDIMIAELLDTASPSPMRTPIIRSSSSHTDRAFLISPSKGMLVGKHESMQWGGAGLRKGISAISQIRRASRLSESEHGPLVTD